MRMLARFRMNLACLAVAALVLLPSSQAVAKADQVLVGASGIKGIQFDTFATGHIDAIEEGQGLRLSRLHFDPCTGIVLHNTGGGVLVYAESTGVSYAFQGGESSPTTALGQGESIIGRTRDFITIVNDTIDAAYSVDLLILSVTEDESFVDVPMITGNPFSKGQQCDEINADGKVTPTILGEGVAAEGGTNLYIGSAFFFPDSTTDGWGLISEGSAFNFLVLTGGISTAAPNSGRAAWIGPGGVIHDSYIVGGQIESIPFANASEQPVFGLAFGTVAENTAVFMPE
jgi:hypothetical protein